MSENKSKALMRQYGANKATIADYEESNKDHQRLVRKIDVILNGETGAARQASLCDLVSQIQHLKHENDIWVPKAYIFTGGIT